MVLRHIVFAGLFATASLAFAGPMGSPQNIDPPMTELQLGGNVLGVNGTGSNLGTMPTHGANLGINAMPGQITPAADVPEPASLLLMLVGLAGAGIVARRRK